MTFASFWEYHIKIAPYRPQSNGCLERFHHTLLQMVRNTEADKMVYLPSIFFICMEGGSFELLSNCFSPFDILLGKHFRGQKDIICEQWVPFSKTPKNQLQNIFRSYMKCSQLCSNQSGQSKRLLNDET